MRKTKTFTFAVLTALIISMIQSPTAQAADSCLVTTPYQENIESDPYYSDAFYVRVGSVCEIKLYDMDISFANIDTVEGLIPLHSDNNDSLSNVKDFNRELRMKWSGSDDEQEGVDYVEFSPDESGDDLFGYWYVVPMSSLNPPATFKRNMPITINSAHYEVNGEMREISNLVLDSVLAKMPDDTKETLMISGVEKQSVSYTEHPVVLAGELTVEENDDGITAEDLTEHYYIYDYYDSSFTPIERPTEPGEFYLVEYTFENDNYRASLRVPFAIKDYIMVDTSIYAGRGEVSAPAFVDMGGDLHVDIVADESYEVVWVEHSGNDVTELLNEDGSLDIEGVEEDAEIVVAFRRFYQVTEGDDGEHTLESGDGLSFVVDKDSASYTAGEVLVIVDDEPVDLNNDVVIEPEIKTITLLSEYLDTLAVGEHNVEFFFNDNGDELAGIARASFTIVKDAEDSEPLVPNTGVFTGKNGSAEMVGFVATMVMMIGALGFVLIRKKAKGNK